MRENEPPGLRYSVVLYHFSVSEAIWPILPLSLFFSFLWKPVLQSNTGKFPAPPEPLVSCGKRDPPSKKIWTLKFSLSPSILSDEARSRFFP